MNQENQQFDEKMATAMFAHALGKLDPNRVTKQELEDFIKAITAYVKKIEDKSTKEMQMMKQALDTAISNLADRHSSSIPEMKAEIMKIVEEQCNKMMLEHESMMAECDAKMATMQDGMDGMDADEEQIVADVLAKLPPVKELEPETTDTLMSKLGITKEDITLLRELPKRVTDIESKPTNFGGGRAAHAMKVYDLTSQTNGILKVFSVPKNVTGFFISSDFPTLLMEGNGYTANKTRTQLTLTPTNAPSSGSQLSFIYAEYFNT